MEKKQLSQDEKKVLKSMFFRSHLVFSTFNMAKMEANGFTLSLIHILPARFVSFNHRKR